MNSGGDLSTVLRDLVLAACRHAGWTMGSIMSIDAPHGHAYVIVRHDPTLIQRSLPDRWELATSPSIVALQRNEAVYIRDARVSEEFPGYRMEAFERDYRSVLVMPMSCLDEAGRPMVLSVISREIMDVSADDLAFIGMIVHLGEIAVEKQHKLREEKRASERLQQALQAHTSLLQQALAESSMPSLAGKIAALVPNPVVVVDFTANLIVASRSPSEKHFDDAAWQLAASTSLHRQIMKVARSAVDQPHSEAHTFFLDDGMRRLRLTAKIEPLSVDAEAVGAMVIFTMQEPFSQLDLLLLDSAKFALSVQMMRSFIRFRFETRTLTELFMEVVEHRWHDPADVMQRAQRLGVGLASPKQMILIDLPEAAQSSAGRLVDPHHAVIRLLQQNSVAADIIVVDNGLVCLIPAELGEDRDRIAKLLRKVAEELGRQFGQEPFVVLSGLCTKLADYP
ncbi:PucR family transcriptional regulator, partial [Mesorhizobium sp. M7A.F.Ca.US.001.02.1.1]|uniref:GAF domain-containing protein n=1 Tax=Mesorhizobium sp. M7A.F.Ca.US.001.02.1.1 TaxID=2496703 RepID=UPI001FDEF08F